MKNSKESMALQEVRDWKDALNNQVENFDLDSALARRLQDANEEVKKHGFKFTKKKRPILHG